MSDYITWNEGEQTNFLRAVKDKTGLTWNEIAEHLNFSRGMLFFYLDESCRMSYETFLKLCKLGNLEPFKFYPHIIKKTKLSKITTLKSYTFPQKTNPQLAEFIGIYLGDGYLGPVSYEVSVSCGEIDYPYITNFIPNLMKRLFSIKPKIIYYKNGVYCDEDSIITSKLNPSSAPLIIGNYNNIYFDGLVDNAIIYNRKLSADEIYYLFNSNSNNILIPVLVYHKIDSNANQPNKVTPTNFEAQMALDHS